MQPEVGMGCTIQMYSDRHAATIVRVSSSGKTVWVQQDIATRTDDNGMSESQQYTYAPNPSAAVQRFYFNKDGQWKGDIGFLNIGIRNEYHDYSF